MMNIKEPIKRAIAQIKSLWLFVISILSVAVVDWYLQPGTFGERLICLTSFFLPMTFRIVTLALNGPEAGKRSVREL